MNCYLPFYKSKWPPFYRRREPAKPWDIQLSWNPLETSIIQQNYTNYNIPSYPYYNLPVPTRTFHNSTNNYNKRIKETRNDPLLCESLAGPSAAGRILP